MRFIPRTLGFAVMLALVAGGCTLSRPAPLKESYLLHATRTGAPLPGAIGRALRVNRFVVAQPFDGRALVYRSGELRFETDFYREFVALPATMMTERTLTWLADAKLFSAVVPMTSSIDSRYVLEGTVTDLYGDFRTGTEPAAIMTVRFNLAHEDARQSVLLDRTFARRIPLATRNAEALVSGFDRALMDILAELERTLAGVVRNERDL